MRKPWRMTRIAEASLADIARLTAGTFGPRQAAAYGEDLVAACRGIADGTVATRDCRRLIDANLPEDLRFARAGRHFASLSRRQAGGHHRLPPRPFRPAAAPGRASGPGGRREGVGPATGDALRHAAPTSG